MLNNGLETMQIVQDVMNGETLKRTAISSCWKSLLTGIIDDITQQGRGGRIYERMEKAKPVSTHQNTKRRSSPPPTFKTIFD